LEVTGRSLDSLARDDLRLFYRGLRRFSAVCTRLDVFADDYQRLMTPQRLKRIIRRGDYTGFRQFHFKETGNRLKNGVVFNHLEVDFGRRGGNGSGKYLRVYDKSLDSKDERNCIRWEVEFHGERANKAFDELSQATSTGAFAKFCGSLVAGSITFVHRTGDNNLSRLVVYKFWERFRKVLGSLVVRIEKKVSDIAGMYRWVRKQVAPTLATLRATFLDEVDYINFLCDVVADGSFKMSQRQNNLAKANKNIYRYTDGRIFDDFGVLIT